MRLYQSINTEFMMNGITVAMGGICQALAVLRQYHGKSTVLAVGRGC